MLIYTLNLNFRWHSALQNDACYLNAVIDCFCCEYIYISMWESQIKKCDLFSGVWVPREWHANREQSFSHPRDSRLSCHRSLLSNWKLNLDVIGSCVDHCPIILIRTSHFGRASCHPSGFTASVYIVRVLFWQTSVKRAPGMWFCSRDSDENLYTVIASNSLTFLLRYFSLVFNRTMLRFILWTCFLYTSIQRGKLESISSVILVVFLTVY